MITVFNKQLQDMRFHLDINAMAASNFCDLGSALGFQAQAKDTRFENSFYVIHFNQELTFSGYDSIMSQEKRKGNLITLLSSHLLITDLNNELNKHAQMYNSRYKVIKTHQSYNRIYEIK